MLSKERDYKAEWQARKERVKQKAYELQALLIEELGGKCFECGSRDYLEFHHPYGRDWEPNRCNFAHRMRLYWRDHLVHKLGLLCSTCNAKDGAMRGYWQRAQTRNALRSKRKCATR